MKWCLIVAMSAVGGFVFGDDLDLAKEKAKVSIHLAKCKLPKRAGVEETSDKPREACHDDMQAALEKAYRGGRPLVLWIGMECKETPELRDSLANAVHCHVKQLNGNNSPRVALYDWWGEQAITWQKGDITAGTGKAIIDSFEKLKERNARPKLSYRPTYLSSPRQEVCTTG
jgi:hypothetical protein